MGLRSRQRPTPVRGPRAPRAFARRYLLETGERMFADAVAINVALLVALMARLLWLLAIGAGEAGATAAFYQQSLVEALQTYRNTAPLLTAVALPIFYLSGFYTHSRAYRSRYKALLIFQAVTLVYLLLATVAYLIRGGMWPPRSAWLGAWLLSLLLVGGLRLWAALWRSTVWAEARIWGRPQRRAVHSVLVIGGAGYIGSILVRKLLARGYHVTVLDALLYGDESVRELYGQEGFELIHGDLRNIEAVTRAMQYADAVVHLGALVGDPACALDEKLTLEINLAATRMIAEAARGFGIERFIFASTCSVYGASDELLDERSALNPVSLYARTKIEAERLLLAMNGEGFAPTVLRFATIYGLSPRLRFDLVVNLLAARATCDKSITIQGGEQWRPFVHVDDVAACLLRCLEAPPATVKGQTFNVGSDEQNYRITEIGDLVEKLIPGTVVVRSGHDADRRNYHVSFARIRRELGFRPRLTVADGIQEIRAAVEEGRIADYRLAIYSNYMTLSEAN
ncbi:MAG TPA: SDR family oxidoreductase, partial [Anaerolineae bacterium]|nr:SDR family oxidoreductase [Anaerolineae bacterium]